MPYSTTQVHGMNGTLKIAGQFIDITEWQADHKNDVKEGTTSKNKGAKSWVKGQRSLDGSFKCIWDTLANPYLINIVPGSTASAELHITDTSYYAVDIIITSVKPSMPINDLVTYDCSFNSQGEITPPV